MTVHEPVTGATQDIEVTAEPDSPVSTLLAVLPFGGPDSTWFVGVQPLDPGTTIADSPLLPGAVLTLGVPGRALRSLPAGVVGAVRVLDGPDAGQVVWLPPGAHAIARDPSAAVCLRDQDVSRRHAVITVATGEDPRVTDAGSSNGTRIGGNLLTEGEGAPWPPGTVLEVGSGLLEWVPLSRAPRPPVRSRDARLDFDRAFAAAPQVSGVKVRLPEPVEAPPGSKAAMLATAGVPLLLGVVLALVMRQPALLLTGLFGPVTWAATAWVERRQRRVRQAGYATARSDAERAIADAVAAEERTRRTACPDLHDLTLAVLGYRSGVWPRNADSPDGLVLRVGACAERACVEFEGTPWEGLDTPQVRGVPATVDLRAAGVLGVVGPTRAGAGLARWLLLQLAALRSPEDLRIVVITSGQDDELAWTGWLPHCDAGEGAGVPCWLGNTDATRRARVAELRDVIARRRAVLRDGERGGFGEEIVVLLDGALALRHLPGMKTVLREGPDVGVYTIAVDRSGMNEARAECAVDDEGNLRLTRSRAELPVTAHGASVTSAHAAWLARALAPLRDRLTLAAAETAIPYPVRFLDLLGVNRPSAAEVARQWAQRPGPCTQIALGADASGPVYVDLATQGPHTMLGGATGAGKSILLQTLVTALLMANRPDELNLVLVDFKGGSAFLPFANCPHVVSLIRSTGETAADVFDEAAAERVLASVRAEVRRREALLARFGGEIDEYWRAGGSAAAGSGGRAAAGEWQPLPRLVLVFDEFARVLETSPDFLKELVNVAAKGRSLGMHLVLATQSLQGKLSPELKNNIDLRITLRQNEPADSVEVLGVPDAAAIPGRLRGRGMILCTKDETRTPTLFQSGYLGDPPPTGVAPPARVRLVGWPALGEPRPQHRAGQTGSRTDQELAIEAVERACAELALPAPRRPLLPALPAVLPLEELPARASAPVPATGVPFGLIDDPDAQAQPAAVLDLAGTDRLMVAGGPQSGRTTVAAGLLSGLVTRFRPDEVHVYVIEREPGGLAAFADTPHCGGVVTPTDPDRIRRLVGWLAAEVQRRATARFAPRTRPDPWIVLVIDGWEHFENRSDPTFVETSLLVTLREVIAAGPPLGIHIVPLGGQDLLNGKLPALFTRRVLLPFPKEELRRAHVPSRSASPPPLPGRGIDAATGLHLQVARPDVAAVIEGVWPTAAAVAAGPAVPLGQPLPGGGVRPAGAEAGAGGGAGAGSGVGVTGGPVRFPGLPVRVSARELAGAAVSRPATWFPLGVGGMEVEPIGVDLFETGPQLLLVSGAAGTGRSTSAATVVHGLRAVGAGVLVVAPPRSPLPDLLPADAGIQVVRGTTVKDSELREAAEAFGDEPYAVVVDDCEQLTLVATQENWDEKPTLFTEIADPGSLGRRGLVLCGDALPILSGQRRSLARLLGEVMTSGARLLLCPTVPSAVREHGLALEADQFFPGPPGRGYLSVGRSTTLVQVAVPG
ncbi:MAG TPA: FtsK/SpoIIIE domain-containing protein [Kineosporiaceae bacterium]|nr:FtsK/SpoIIIE domain-containing protein [Kineosporiaceae bacterium]